MDEATLKRHFRRADPRMADVIARVGPYTLKPQRERFRTLARSIVSQQISTTAARTIYQRLEQRLKPHRILPETVKQLSIDDLRLLGLSRQKAAYLHDLAEKCADGTVQLTRVQRMDDEAIIEMLTQVKGIGRWSAQMFLIFSLGRPNVFPHDDLGVRNALQRIYQLEELPKKAVAMEIGARWTPYATVGSWYCWRYLELKATS